MSFDWTRCMICQDNTSEVLKCPLNAIGGSDASEDVYNSFLRNVDEFHSINALPVQLKFGSDTSVHSLCNRRASWHKSCHLKFSLSKLNKAKERVNRKRKEEIKENERISVKRQKNSTEKCLFCDNGIDGGDLHSFTTFDADKNVRLMATELQEFQLLSKISGGDLISLEAKYHLNCMTSLRNRYKNFSRKKGQDGDGNELEEKLNEARAFLELTNHVEKSVESGTQLFKLSELHSLYVSRLIDLGITKTVNKTRLKNSLLEHFAADADEQFDGKNVVLIFKEGIKNLLRDALKKRDFSDDAAIFAKTAAILRKDIFSHKGFNFSGSFPMECQEQSVPSSLKLLVSLVLNGLNLKKQEKCDSQVCLTVCQTILFNTKKRVSDPKTAETRHTRPREPPLPMYIGLNIHALTRSKTLITRMYQLGISISYDRIIEIEEWLATSVSQRFKEDGIVSPVCLRKGIFSVGALDNIDHNPSSTTATSSFHGTGISIFQFPTENQPGEYRPQLVIPPHGNQSHCLPDEYTTVPLVALKPTTVSVPECIMTERVQSTLTDAEAQEDKWVEHALQKLNTDNLTADDNIAWAAYHSSSQPHDKNPPGLTALLPLFYEKSATPAMIKHGMNVIRQAIAFLNPGQTPVMTVDQPLFALAKMVQWKWPNTHGEQDYVIMFGGLHMEMALWNTLGDVLEKSGWTSALTEAEVASSGVADSFLKVSHLTRTRHAHQITLLAFHNLKLEAFSHSATDGDESSMITWEDSMRTRSPTFFFWDMIMRYETLILIFIRAHRERNFSLYVEVLEELVHLFFALDHVNYARWAPIHIRDMKSLPESIVIEFQEQSHWVLSKTNNKFSAIPLDQAHEQENKKVKSSGGAVGLTENPVAFRRWMLSGPEISRTMQQFEEQYLPDNDPENPRNFLNHEIGRATQANFQRQVKSLSDVVRRMGNPFLDDFQELVTLDSRDCVDASVVETVRTLETTGKKQYQDYVNDVIKDRKKSIHDPIKKNNFPLFRKSNVRSKSKHGKKIAMLQNNVALFAQMYIATQSRDGDMKDFFSHEAQSFPPSLSEFGNLRVPSAKSELLKCLVQPEQPDPPAQFDCRVLDGAVIVHSLPITGAVTFDNYADNVFLPYIAQQLRESKRVDIVWDTYIAESLKESTREKRGTGARRKVSGKTKLPTNWMQFLRDPVNKTELFAFLTSKTEHFYWPSGRAIHITSGKSVVSCGSSSFMPNCNHEEADTRIVVHIIHALKTDNTRSIMVRTVDTDVVVILVGKFHEFIIQNPDVDIWVAFGMGRHFSYISINSICSTLGESRSRSLPVFHAFSGCDTTSSFNGKGKRSVWQAWEVYADVTPVLESLASDPFQRLSDNSENFQKLERLTIIMYDKLSPLDSVNEARMVLFCKQNRSIERLPPTQDALLQHVRRAVYQAGIWTTSDQPEPVVPSPEDFAWSKVDDAWTPVWMEIPEVSKVCRELIKCTCKGRCHRCKCAKAQLDCTPLCKCKCNK